MQWYENNPLLYEREKKRMLDKYPNAKEIKLKNGNLAWQVTMKLSGSGEVRAWTFLLVYKKDFPESADCDSIRIVPLRPSYEELKKRLTDAIGGDSVDISGVPYCIRTPDGVTCLSVKKPKEEMEQSAVRYALAAYEWAFDFELALMDKNTLRKWMTFLKPAEKKEKNKKAAAEEDSSVQWYKKDKRLFETEISVMKRMFRDAEFGFLENGNMYWKITTKVSQSGFCDDWTFLLVYDPEHPEPDGIKSNSVEILPKKPSYKELKARVNETKGKFFDEEIEVPHTHAVNDGVRGLSIGDIYKTAEVKSINSAAVYANYAVEWALYFELAMRENRVWNKWVEACDQEKLHIFPL